MSRKLIEKQCREYGAFQSRRVGMSKKLEFFSCLSYSFSFIYTSIKSAHLQGFVSEIQ